MKIQLMSDLHLELMANPQKKVLDMFEQERKDTVLVLAGDIGSPFSPIYRLTLNLVVSKYLKVIVISGNHEYYQQKPVSTYDPEQNKVVYTRHTIDEIDAQIRTVCQQEGAVFLQKDVYQLDDMTFVGCTLWSPGHVLYDSVVNDSRYSAMDIYSRQDINKDHIAWLKTVITPGCIVVTHHLPTYQMIDKEFLMDSRYSDMNSFFANHLPTPMLKKPRLWLCGHSHRYCHKVIGDCRLYLNPHGYPDETSHFENNLIIEV